MVCLFDSSAVDLYGALATSRSLTLSAGSGVEISVEESYNYAALLPSRISSEHITVIFFGVTVAFEFVFAFVSASVIFPIEQSSKRNYSFTLEALSARFEYLMTHRTYSARECIQS